MSGSKVLTKEERRQMLDDARNPVRRAAFAAAQRLGHEGGLDDYIDFLSENMDLGGPWRLRVHVTVDDRL